LYDQRGEANIGEVINIALEQIEEANKQKLSGVFRNIDFNSEANLGQTKDRNARLKHLLEDFNDTRIDLSPSRVGNLDVIGNAYMFLIEKFAAGAGKKAGEFYTPEAVSELIAELVNPQAGERICDPGSLPASSCPHLSKENGGLATTTSNFMVVSSSISLGLRMVSSAEIIQLENELIEVKQEMAGYLKELGYAGA
jgi:hypothetical protein